MTCHQVQKSLSDYLDDSLDAEIVAQLEAHLTDCPACRAALAELRRIDELLTGFRDPPVDEERLGGLWSRVRLRLDEAPVTEMPQAAAAYLSDAPVLVPQPATQPRWLMPTLVAGGVVTVAAVVLAVALAISERDASQRRERLAQGSRQAAGDMAASDMAAGDTAASDMAAGMEAMDAMAAMDAMDAMGVQAAMDAIDDMGASAPTTPMATLPPRTMAIPSARAAPRRRRPHRVGGYFGGGSRSGGTVPMRPQPRPMTGGSRGAGSSGGSAGRSGGGSNLQDLLRRASGGRGGGGGGASSALPKRLSMGNIRSGVGRILGTARACYKRHRVAGTCRVRVVISGSTGRPVSVSVLGTFSGTPTGRCVARAFRRARFRRFQNTSQSFVFPLVFR